MPANDDGCIRPDESKSRRTLFYFDFDFDELFSPVESDYELNITTTPTGESPNSSSTSFTMDEFESESESEEIETAATIPLQETDPNPAPASTPVLIAEPDMEIPINSPDEFNVNQGNNELNAHVQTSHDQGYVEIGEPSGLNQNNADPNNANTVEIMKLLKKIEDFIKEYESCTIYKEMIFWYIARNDPTYYHLINEKLINLDEEPYIPSWMFQEDSEFPSWILQEIEEYDIDIQSYIFSELEEEEDTEIISDQLGGGDCNAENIDDPEKN